MSRANGLGYWLACVYVGGRLAAEGWVRRWRWAESVNLPMLKRVAVGELVEVRHGNRVVGQAVVTGLRVDCRGDGYQHRVLVSPIKV